MPPEVTAIVTTNARPAHVQEAIASLRAETHESVELVVVDDGCGFTAPSGLPLRVVQGVDLGVGRARNLGLAAAQGEFVLFLDDDDVALPHRIATLVSAARRHQAEVCFGRTRRVLDQERRAGSPAGPASISGRLESRPYVFDGPSQGLPDVPTHLPSSQRVAFADLLTCAPHINAVLARTETLRAVGGFDAEARHFDDWSAWLRLADRGAVIWSVPETVAEWRIHQLGLSGKVLGDRAMKTRVLSLFDRLEPSLSNTNARAVAAAREIVKLADIATYDDYADAMAAARPELRV
ncbi:MAG: glycosyltransferase family 2 protein [Acidobacteria bacterium]|nr:glycosyltransferase family 2 protein [Acidobacteriota bacterium]